MNQATLQRLMIDDALGELPPDTAELLQAYVAGSNQAETATWNRLAEMTRKAMESNETLPAFPHAKMRRWQHLRIARISVGIAAVLIVGVAIGVRMPRGSAPMPQQVAQTDIPEAAGVQGFWSSQRLIASAMQSHPRPSEPGIYIRGFISKPGDIQ